MIEVTAKSEGSRGHLKGYMKFEMVSKDGKVTKLYENTITDIGLLLMLAQSANHLLPAPAAFGLGEWQTSSGFSISNPYGENTSIRPPTDMFTVDADSGLTAYLLDVPSTTTLSTSSKYLPVYDSYFNYVPANVIGYATVRRSVPSTNTLEGVAIPITPSNWTDDTGAYAQWEFGLTQANGTFNTIAIGAGVISSRFNGFTVGKGVNQSDYANQPSNNSQVNPAYFAPGISGLTADNIILLSVDGSGTSSATFDLDTGVLTNLATGAATKGIALPAQGSGQVVVSGVLYYLVDDPSSTSATFNLMAMNLTTLAVSVLVSNISSSAPLSLFYYNTYLYVGDGATGGFAGYTTAGAAGPALTMADLNLPSDFTYDGMASTSLTSNNVWIIGNTGRYHVTLYIEPSNPSPSYTLYQSYGITVTSIVACSTTIVDLKPHMAATIYAEGTSGNDMLIDSNFFADWGNHDVGVAGTDTYFANNPSPVISRGYWGNLISYVTLSAATTKTSSDIVYLTYGYQFT